MYTSKVFMIFFRTVHTWGFDEGVSCGRDIHTQGSSYWYEDNARCTSDKLKRNTNVLGKNSVSLQEPNSRSINWFVKLRSKYITSVRKWIQILDLQWSKKKTFIQYESPKRQRLWIKVFFNRLPIVLRDILKGIMTNLLLNTIYLKLQRKRVISYLNELTRMKAFYYGGCVNQIPATQHACQIRIQLLNRHPGIFHHGVDWKI